MRKHAAAINSLRGWWKGRSQSCHKTIFRQNLSFKFQIDSSNSTMATFYEATALNNSGAYHLLNNNHGEAIASFRCAVHKTEELLCQQSKVGSQEGALPPSREGLHVDFIDLERSNRIIKGAYTSSDSFVCQSAMIISQDTSKGPPSHLLPMISMSAIYNLAVAHHLYGIRNRASPYLQKALRYYEISYRIQREHPLCYNSSHVLCILNNVAMIYRLIHDHQKSIKMLRQLYSVMSLLDLDGQKKNQRHWAGLWSNVLCLVLDPPATSPAA